jgi:dTDP-4-dehydrorhamnose reductase
MDRLLITDVNRFLGAGVAAALADRFEVLGCGDEPPADLDCRIVGLPTVSDWSEVIGDAAPHWIIHCDPHSLSSWDLDETQPQTERRSDLAALALSAREHAIRLTVLSTDAVFTGPRLFHSETSPHREGNARIQSIREWEQVALDLGALVVRTHAYGWDSGGRNEGFAQRAWNALDRGQPLRLDADRHASPIFVDDLAELLVRAYRRNLGGLYHIAGGERTSPYRFAVELATACGVDSAAMAPLPQETAADGWAPREETSLDCRRARQALEAAMPLLREGLTRFAARQPNRPSKRAPRRTPSISRHAA